MSYQRAVVNCNACYKLAKRGLDETNEEVMNARNLALQGLEDVWHMGMLADSQELIALVNQELRTAKQALDACMGCKFECPGIARVYENSGA